MSHLIEWVGAMLGLGMSLAISHKATSGSSPPSGASPTYHIYGF